VSGYGWRPTRFHRGAVICGGVFYLVTVALLVPRLDDLDREVLLVRNIGLLIVLALPLALAVVSLFARPSLLLPAATFSVLISPMMWSGLPLVFIPGVVYGIAFAKAGSPPLSALQIVTAIVIPVALGITSFGLLVGDTTTTCAEERTATSSRSVCADVPSTASVVGVGLVVSAAVGAAAYASTPRQQPLPPFSHPIPTAER
jgi:hypothetical protein